MDADSVMDFRSLDVGAKPATQVETIHDFTPIDPASIETDGDSKPFLNGAGAPLVLRLVDPSSPTARRSMVKLRIKWPTVDPDGGLFTEEELDRAAANDEGRGRELLARFVAGWNIEHEGAPVPFSVENAAEFFEVFPAVAAVTMIRVSELMSASGNVESGSPGGPRKKAGSRTSSKTPGKAGGKR